MLRDRSTGRGGGVGSHLNSPVCVVISDVHRFVLATYLLFCSKRDASVRQPARTRDELDVLQLGGIRRAAEPARGYPNDHLRLSEVVKIEHLN